MKKLQAMLVLVCTFAVLTMTSCSMTMPINATSNPVGSKVGKASTTQILSMFNPDGGDASIRTAAKNGGITNISTVDFKRNMVFLNFVVSYETIVTGE